MARISRFEGVPSCGDGKHTPSRFQFEGLSTEMCDRCGEHYTPRPLFAGTNFAELPISSVTLIDRLQQPAQPIGHGWRHGHRTQESVNTAERLQSRSAMTRYMAGDEAAFQNAFKELCIYDAEQKQKEKTHGSDT